MTHNARKILNVYLKHDKIMTIEEADKIITNWGRYMELMSHSNMSLFLVHIPESILPYSKESIAEASDMMIDYYTNSNNEEAANIVETCKANLLFYKDDEESIDNFIRMWGDTNSRARLLKALKESQGEWQN